MAKKKDQVTYKVWMTVEKCTITAKGEEIFENLDEDTQSAGVFKKYEGACKRMEEINTIYGSIEAE